MLGIVYLQTGNTQSAFEHFGNALTFDPTDPKVLLAHKYMCFTSLSLHFFLSLFLSFSLSSFASVEYVGSHVICDMIGQTILAAGSIIQECEDYDVALVKYRVSAGICMSVWMYGCMDVCTH